MPGHQVLHKLNGFGEEWAGDGVLGETPFSWGSSIIRRSKIPSITYLPNFRRPTDGIFKPHLIAHFLPQPHSHFL
jgi:hypothetical protein